MVNLKAGKDPLRDFNKKIPEFIERINELAKLAKKMKSHSGEKYLKTPKGLKGGKLDVYSVIETFGVECPAIQHALKKLLFPGKRGKNETLADLDEARDAINRAVELEEGRGRIGGFVKEWLTGDGSTQHVVSDESVFLVKCPSKGLHLTHGPVVFGKDQKFIVVRK